MSKHEKRIKDLVNSLRTTTHSLIDVIEPLNLSDYGKHGLEFIRQRIDQICDDINELV